MVMRVFPLVLAAILLAGCAASSRPATAPASIAATTPSPVATVGWSDTSTCKTFREATTTGVPASAAGENTMTWLQQQDGNAYPRLQAAISRFARAWADPADLAGISRAQRAVTRICHS
jgi:hypothetical protein